MFDHGLLPIRTRTYTGAMMTTFVLRIYTEPALVWLSNMILQLQSQMHLKPVIIWLLLWYQSFAAFRTAGLVCLLSDIMHLRWPTSIVPNIHNDLVMGSKCNNEMGGPRLSIFRAEQQPFMTVLLLTTSPFPCRNVSSKSLRHATEHDTPGSSIVPPKIWAHNSWFIVLSYGLVLVDFVQIYQGGFTGTGTMQK